MNWKKEHKGAILKNIFWRAVRSTYLEDYKQAIEDMKQEDVAAFEDFINRDVKKFCKVFLSTNVCSDMVDNNISETFNGYILNARGKHVIHMLEEIMISLMVRQVKKLSDIEKVDDILTPLIRKKLEKLSTQSKHCIPHPALGGKFEIDMEGDKFVVHVEARTCTCRVWQMVGIPCIHGIAAIEFMEQDPAKFVNDYYTIERYKKAYSFGLEPLNGQRLWPVVEGYVVKPPAIRKMPGRPKLKRKRAAHEVDPSNPNKLRRQGQKVTCKNCGQSGHNSRGCKNMTVVKPPKEKGKPGRPRTRNVTGTKPREESSNTRADSSSQTRGRGRGRRGGRGRGETLRLGQLQGR